MNKLNLEAQKNDIPIPYCCSEQWLLVSANGSTYPRVALQFSISNFLKTFHYGILQTLLKVEKIV